MTLDPGKLADAIDPRIRGDDGAEVSSQKVGIEIYNLIAASDALRALPSLQDEDDLVRRLMSHNDAFPDDVIEEAATTIQALRMRVATLESESLAAKLNACPGPHLDALIERGARALNPQAFGPDAGEYARLNQGIARDGARAVITEILGEPNPLTRERV
jgi:hypothetical protein